MKVRYPSNHLIYSISSIVCPFLAFIAIWTYQSMAHSEFWKSISSGQDPDHAAGAMMAFVEVVQMIVALTIGCLVGVMLGLKSMQIQKWKIGIGTITVCLNGLPLLILITLIV